MWRTQLHRRYVAIANRYCVTAMETVDDTAPDGRRHEAGVVALRAGRGSRDDDGRRHDLLPDSVERMFEGLRELRSRAAVGARDWAKDGQGLAWRLQRLEFARRWVRGGGGHSSCPGAAESCCAIALARAITRDSIMWP